MAEKNYQNFVWYDQTVDNKPVNFVRVRIYKPLDAVKSDGNMQLAATDGNTFQKSRRSFLKYTSQYSYVVLSSGIKERGAIYSSNHPYLYLHIKVYLTDDFDLSSLNDVDFLGKSYVIEAIQGETAPEPSLPPLLNYFRKKVGNDYEEFYFTLRNSAQSCHFNLVDQLFKSYNISAKYQALFWKEMFELAKTKR